MIVKKRLDLLIAERYPQYSRQQIQSWIMQGKVRIDGLAVVKPGSPIAQDKAIELDIAQPKYVSRAGFKIEKALEHFNIDVAGFTVLDAGLSTGGFTDCLLQAGAVKIYGVDVGHGQVHEKISNDPRVAVHERTNLRLITQPFNGQPVDLVTLDLSFISILKVMDAVVAVLKPDGQLITLIKPQFESRKEQVSRGGIVKDMAVHQEVIKRVTDGVCAHGFSLIGVTDSPILGTDGNKEFLAYFKRSA